jgi:hypothetical protein
MKARITQLYKTEAEWLKLPNFKPLPGEIIIFAPDDQHSYTRMKIGDGNTLLTNLPFFGITELDDPRRTNKVIDAGSIADYGK